MFGIDSSAVSDEDRDKFDIVRIRETFGQTLVLLLTVCQLVVRVCTSTGFELQEEQGRSLVYDVLLWR